MARGWVMVVVAVSTCALRDVAADPRAASTKLFAAPEATSTALSWRIGQWVKYERRHRDGVASEELRIVARDTCGYWIEHSSAGNGVRYSWLFCVRAQPGPDDSLGPDTLQAVIERRNREVVSIRHHNLSARDWARLCWLLSLVHAPPSGWDVVREDVATPAGQFAQATKVSTSESNVTRWSHAAVPLGGIVKEVTSEYERVLVDFGLSGGGGAIATIVADLELAQRSFREVNDVGAAWIGMRLGFDGLGTPGDVAHAIGFGGTSGVNVAPAFAATLDVTWSIDAPSPKDPTLAENMLLGLAGIRWFPFGRSRRSARTGMHEHALLYAQADAGYAQLDRRAIDGESTTVGRGVAAGARLGFIALQGRGWTYGIELHDHFALLNSDEGLRHSFGAQVVVQLFSAPQRYSLPW